VATLPANPLNSFFSRPRCYTAPTPSAARRSSQQLRANRGCAARGGPPPPPPPPRGPGAPPPLPAVRPRRPRHHHHVVPGGDQPLPGLRVLPAAHGRQPRAARGLRQLAVRVHSHRLCGRYCGFPVVGAAGGTQSLNPAENSIEVLNNPKVCPGTCCCHSGAAQRGATGDGL
jgi:hypothetical protein